MSKDFQRPPDVSKSLAHEADKAVGLLVKLTKLQDQSCDESAVMPKLALKSAQGMAFTYTTRAALGVGFTTGSGFAIALLGEKDGKRRWSAPCFFYVTKLTLGLSYGMGRIDTCVVMRSKSVVDTFKHGQAIFGLDSRFLVCAEEAQRSLSLDESATPYSIADGAMVDVSLNGGLLLLDRTENHKYFGADATGESIIDGTVPSPPEFSHLYDALDTLLDDIAAS